MLLKFGQIVDLEKLEVLSSNPIIEEHRRKLRKMEQDGNKELLTLRERIERKKRELIEMIKENTIRLNRMHDLITTKTRIEERLDVKQKNMVRGWDKGRPEDKGLGLGLEVLYLRTRIGAGGWRPKDKARELGLRPAGGWRPKDKARGVGLRPAGGWRPSTRLGGSG